MTARSPFPVPLPGRQRAAPARSRMACLPALAMTMALAACTDEAVPVIDPEPGLVTSMSPGGSGLPGTAVLQVRLATVGEGAEGGYTLLVGSEGRTVAPSDTVIFSRMAAGPVVVELAGVPQECRVGGENPRTVQVPARGPVRTDFHVTCDRTAGLSAAPSGATVRATIGAAGGLLEAIGDDGTRMVLAIPAGALPVPVEISMTPARFSGLPGAVEAFLGGAILEPSGLTFAVPATLTLAPADGVEGRAWPMGFVADDQGGVEWSLPRGGEAPETMDIDVPHFSLAGVSVLTQAYWYLLYEMYGVRPVLLGDRMEIHLQPGRSFYRTPACFRVTGIDNAPLMGIPVEMEMAPGSVGSLASDAGVTERDGTVCVDHAFDVEDLSRGPIVGGWALIQGVTIPGHRFEHRNQTTIAIIDPREVTLGVEFPPVVRSHEPFEVCAFVDFVGREPGDPSNLETGVAFPAHPGDPAWYGDFLNEVYRRARELSPIFTGGGDGRGCTVARISVPHYGGDGELRLPLRVAIERVDPANPGGLRAIVLDTTLVVEAGPYTLGLSGPGNVAPGAEAELCAELRRGEMPVNGFRTVLTREGEGGFRSSSGEIVDESSTVSGTAGVSGRGCVTYVAPESPEGEDVRILAVATIQDFRSALADDLELEAQWVLPFDGPELLLSATPALLVRGGDTSQICALLRREQGMSPIPGAPISFSMTGPGSLGGTSAVTDDDGEACLTYRAPDPLAGLTDVVIEAEVSSVEGAARSSVTVRLGMPFALTLSATPASLVVGGGTSAICGTLRDNDAGAPVAGTPVIFSVGGPGFVSPAVVSTAADGRACTTYNAPSPLPTGTTNVVITGQASTDLGAVEGSATVRLSSSLPLAILTTNLPEGRVDGGYLADILAGGGAGLRTWSLVGGALPPGLAFSQVGAQGQITGVPTAAGSFDFVLRVATTTESVQQAYTLVVYAPTVGGGGGGGGGPRCFLTVGEYPGGGTYLDPPFSLRASVGIACGSGVQVDWTGGTRNNDLVTITEIPGFTILGGTALQPDPNDADRLLGYVTVDYNRTLFLSPMYPQREGVVRGCLSRNGEPILNDIGDQVCANWRWFN